MEFQKPQPILQKTRRQWEMGQAPLLVSKRDAAALLGVWCAASTITSQRRRTPLPALGKARVSPVQRTRHVCAT